MSDGTLEAFRRYLFQDEPWRTRAACRAMGSETLEETKARMALFFPHRGESQKPAKTICARCPVQEECAAYALRSKSSYGLWAGEIRHRTPEDTRRRRAGR